MNFISCGLKELLKYGNLNQRSTKADLLAAFVLALPALFIAGIAIQVLAISQKSGGSVAASVIYYSCLILLMPFLVATVIRRVNDQFPVSAWARFFSQISDGSFGYVIRISVIWILLLVIATAIFVFAWPLYLLFVLLVLIFPKKIEVTKSNFSYVPPPPSGKSSLPSIPTFGSTQTSVSTNESELQNPIYKQGIFWFSVALALAVAVFFIASGIHSNIENDVPAPTVSEPQSAPTATPLPTATSVHRNSPTATPTAVSVEGVVEQTVPVGLDPRFNTCGEANAAGYGPYVSGVNPEYDWYIDRDKDGINCER